MWHPDVRLIVFQLSWGKKRRTFSVMADAYRYASNSKKLKTQESSRRHRSVEILGRRVKILYS
jgi:hypothetical protein